MYKVENQSSSNPTNRFAADVVIGNPVEAVSPEPNQMVEGTTPRTSEKESGSVPLRISQTEAPLSERSALPAFEHDQV